MPVFPDQAVYLMDASAFIHRAYHAVRQMATSSGFPTGAAFGFTATLLKLLRDCSPKYLAVVFDSRGKNRRHEMYAGYKANRPRMEPDLAEQQPKIRELVRLLGLAGLEKPGFEADDLIASMCRLAVSEGRKVVIVSGDKDFYQLLSADVSMYDPDPKKNSALTAEDFRARFGLEPEAFLDVQALMGDSSDNIPGVPKVGEKTALKLVSDYGTLEGVYEHLDDLPPKSVVKKNLAEFREAAWLSRELARLGAGLEPPAAIEDLAPREPEAEELAKAFEELEFGRFLKEMAASGPVWLQNPGFAKAAAPGKSAGPGPAGPLFGGRKGPAPNLGPRGPVETDLVETPEAWSKLQGDCLEVKEKGGLLALLPERSPDGLCVGLGLSWREGRAAYVPVGHKHHRNQHSDDLRERLAPFLASPLPRKVSLDCKTDLRILGPLGLAAPMENPGGADGESGRAPFPYEDLTLASYLLNPDDKHDLGSLAEAHLNASAPEIGGVRVASPKKPDLATASPADAAPYCGKRAEIVLALAPALRARLAAEPELERLYDEVELPLAGLLARVEEKGVLVDPGALRVLSGRLAEVIDETAEKIYEKAGKRFNIGSPRQLSDVLFLDMKIPTGKRTAMKTAYSTDNEVLSEIGHPVAADIISWREYSKLKNTYADKLPLAVRKSDGRIHTTFNQALTATGRLSSSDPNLQNIPARTEEGRSIRAAFIAPPGFRLVSADYSQIELRVMAHFSGDRALLDAFANNEDVHAQTAAEIFGAGPAGVTAEARRQAKTINFGIIYGQGAFGLAKQLGVPRTLAAEFISRYFARFPGVKKYMERARAEAYKAGFVTTWFGRRRYLPGLASSNRTLRGEAERMAINTPVQGTAADVIKMAMLLVDRKITELGLKSRIILQVHDELVLEAPEAELETVGDLLAGRMAAAGQNPPLTGGRPLAVPLRVDVASGQAWVHA
ncbi:MAG: DNA polymerase I [Deltaproteobacteria bacterium]|nr:DNA polymerase I [Deltaproteobacteria bacterium]